MLLSEAKVIFPFESEAPKPNDPPLFEAMNPLRPWKATLLLETPIGGVNISDRTGEYLL